MPRNPNAPSGADALGLTADLEGVTDVPQGASKFDNVVIDFTKLPSILIPDGTDVRCQVKSARPGITKKGFPKVSLMLEIISDTYTSEVFFDDLIFMPPMPPSKGTMWRVHQFCDSINYQLPEGGITGAEIMSFLKQFCEDILGEQFDATLKIQYSTEIDPKSQTGEVYKPRNTVKSFNPQGKKSLDDLIFS